MPRVWRGALPDQAGSPLANGQVERFNRTLKEATAQRYHYKPTAQLNEHLQAFLLAYNHAKRLKRLRGFVRFSLKEAILSWSLATGTSFESACLAEPWLKET